MKEINCAVRPPAWWLRHMGASRPVGVQAPIPHPFSNEGRAKVAHSKKKSIATWLRLIQPFQWSLLPNLFASVLESQATGMFEVVGLLPSIGNWEGLFSFVLDQVQLCLHQIYSVIFCFPFFHMMHMVSLD
jgi:hypothetical protein